MRKEPVSAEARWYGGLFGNSRRRRASMQRISATRCVGACERRSEGELQHLLPHSRRLGSISSHTPMQSGTKRPRTGPFFRSKGSGTFLLSRQRRPRAPFSKSARMASLGFPTVPSQASLESSCKWPEPRLSPAHSYGPRSFNRTPSPIIRIITSFSARHFLMSLTTHSSITPGESRMTHRQALSTTSRF